MKTQNVKKPRRYMGRSFISLFIIMIIAMMTIQGNVLGQEEVRVFITGPDSIPTNGSIEYTIRVIGGPAEFGESNWTMTASIGNPIPQGADVFPFNVSSKNNIFSVNVTAPRDPRDITLVVNATSANETESEFSGLVTKEIDVFRPVTVNITATIRNPTQIDVRGALISFNVDGEFLGNLTETVLANSTKEVYWEWIASKDDRGEHEIEVRINEDSSILEFDGGDNVMKQTIYIGKRPDREQRPIMVFNSGFVLIIEIIAILFVLGAYLMRRNTIRGRGYYSPRSTYSMYFTGILLIALSIPVFSVSQILVDNPEVGDSTGRLIDGVLIFILGFLIVMFTWDRSRKKR
jgi:hypothetical protein